MKNYLVILAFAAASTQAFAGTVTSDGPDIVIKTKGGLSVKTADGKYGFGIGGRLQIDYDNTETNSTRSANDLGARRARLAFTGFAGDWSFKTDFNVDEDVGGGHAGGTVEDLYIRYSGWGKGAILTIGKQKEAFGLEKLTSSKYITMLERSAFSETYAPGRNVGVTLSGGTKNVFYNLGLFDRDRKTAGNKDVSQIAVAGRLAFAPVNEKGRVVHLAGAYRAAEDADTYGLEAATIMGPFHAQAEYASQERTGSSDVDSFYVQLGYVVTGESRHYKKGKLYGIKPSGKGGAVELALRYEDGYGKYSDLGLAKSDGEQTAIGINWYFNNNARFGLSYMDGELDSGPDGQELRARVQFIF